MPKDKKINHYYEHNRNLPTSRADWMDALVQRIQQQPSMLHQPSSFYDLTGLVQHQTKMSVDDVVKDLRKRVGLDSYLSMVTSSASNKKIAQTSNLSVTDADIKTLLSKANITDDKASEIIQAAHDMIDRNSEIPVVCVDLNKFFGKDGLTEQVTESDVFKTWLSNLIVARDINKPDEVTNNMGQDDQDTNDRNYQENQDFFRNMKG